VSRRADGKLHTSRRGFFAATAGLVAATGAGFGAGTSAAVAAETMPIRPDAQSKPQTEPFWGRHQAGIVTPAQSHTYFVALDLVTAKRDDVVNLLRAWTAAAARMAAGETAEPLDGGLKPAGGPKPAVAHGGSGVQPKSDDSYETPDSGATAADSGEALGLPPARLTLTFGFGAGLFIRDGRDRYGLAARRPEGLVDLPRFAGDQLVEAHTGGDISVQACADDPQVAFHAVRQLARLAAGVAQVRWAQTGFIPSFGGKETPRNLMGFRDGTNNPSIADPKAMEKFVWVGDEGPDWMRGGSYLVARRIRIALEHWDRMPVAFQEQTVGRHKYSGAPLGKEGELDPLDLDATDKDGNPVIPESAHVRLAAAASNDDAQILRRPYSYNDGVNFTAERWPPWRQGMEYDAGLFFLAYQRDPRTGFIKIFDRMAKLDMMNQFVTHVGGGLFACARGSAEGEFIGQTLFETT
jgi:deferrochelatase/peroxidase EfeB